MPRLSGRYENAGPPRSIRRPRRFAHESGVNFAQRALTYAFCYRWECRFPHGDCDSASAQLSGEGAMARCLRMATRRELKQAMGERLDLGIKGDSGEMIPREAIVSDVKCYSQRPR